MKKRNIKKIRDWNTKTKVNSSPVSFNDDKKDLKNKKNNKKKKLSLSLQIVTHKRMHSTSVMLENTFQAQANSRRQW